MISKKELLDKTGISYGQLYRWKREGLIPEEWFVKKSSFTGQETFFPRDKILERINAIQALKDKYSLEELAKLLSPELTERYFSKGDLKKIEEINPELAEKAINRRGNEPGLIYMDVLVLAALSGAIGEIIGADEALKLYESINPCLEELKNAEYSLILTQSDELYALLLPEGAKIYTDIRLKIIFRIELSELASRLRLKYKSGFNFDFDIL